MKKVYNILFKTPKVVVRKDKNGEVLPTRIASFASSSLDGRNIIFDYVDGPETGASVVGGINLNKKTGIITFKDSSGGSYYIRPLRPEDGYWMSKYKTPVPEASLMVAINRLSGSGASMFDKGEQKGESLIAFTYPGRNILVGAIYNDSKNSWIRIANDWSPLLEGDKQLLLQDALIVEISPDRADDFLNKYDEVYLDINQINEYLMTEELA